MSLSVEYSKIQCSSGEHVYENVLLFVTNHSQRGRLKPCGFGYTFHRVLFFTAGLIGQEVIMTKVNFSIPTAAFEFILNWWLSPQGRVMDDFGKHSARRAEHYKPLAGVGAEWMLFPRNAWTRCPDGYPLLTVTAECSEEAGVMSGAIEANVRGYEADIVELIHDMVWGVRETDSDITPLLPSLEEGRQLALPMLEGYGRNASFVNFFGCDLHPEDSARAAQLRDSLDVFESWLVLEGRLTSIPGTRTVRVCGPVSGRISGATPNCSNIPKPGALQ